MKLISWGFIGCGEVTEKKSGPAFNEVEGSHVEAVMSRSEEKVRSYAERHHIKKWYLHCHTTLEPRHFCHHGYEGGEARLCGETISGKL